MAAAKGNKSTDFRSRWSELLKVNPVSCEIEDMDAISLNYWLTKFVMEVAKDSGERYPPRTVSRDSVWSEVSSVKQKMATSR